MQCVCVREIRDIFLVSCGYVRFVHRKRVWCVKVYSLFPWLQAKSGPTPKTKKEFKDLIPTLEAFYADHNAHLGDLLTQIGANISEFDFVQPGWKYKMTE